MKTKNLTPFPFGAKLTSRRPPELEMTLIVRGAFRLAPHQPLTPLDEIPGVSQGAMTAETFRDDDHERRGECLYGGDFADFKLNAEVMLRGTCYAAGERPVTDSPVKLSVGAWSKTLRVVGRRVWSDGFTGAAISDPIPFTRMPLDYAGAFGGPGYALNPAGKGFGTGELPNVELARELVRSTSDRPTPASFGPLNPAWPQRAGKIGKEYGRSYVKKRAPFYAEDFDWSYFQAAPADQQLPGYLRGDEEVVFHNLHPTSPVFSVSLPALRIRVFVTDVNGRFREARMNLDTLFADPDAATLFLTWRGIDQVLDEELADVATVLIASEPLGEAPLPEAHYRAALAAFEADPIGIQARAPAGSLQMLEVLARGPRAPDASDLPAADPVSGRLRGRLDVVDLETRGRLEREVSSAFVALKGSPGPSPGLMEAFEKAVAAVPDAGPRTVLPFKPGAVPPLPIGDKLREARVTVAEAKAQTAAMGGDVSAIEKIEALFNDPRLGAIDPSLREGALPPIEPGPGRDLSGRNFTGADLRGRDLRGASFDGSILTRADLSGACLAGADLSHAVLFQANLEGADLSSANLTLANLTEANAASASFSRATLVRTYAQKTSLRGANFSLATGEYLLFADVDLTGADARGIRLFKSLFRGGDLTRADLADADLTRCHFLGARAVEIRLANARLDHTSFAGSDLSRGRLADARGAGSIWQKAVLDGADFSYAVLPAAHFSEASADGARFFGANLKGARFNRALLEGADFTRSNLFGADLSRALVSNVRFTDANLYDAKLHKTAGAGCDFTGANLKRSTLESA